MIKYLYKGDCIYNEIVRWKSATFSVLYLFLPADYQKI